MRDQEEETKIPTVKCPDCGKEFDDREVYKDHRKTPCKEEEVCAPTKKESLVKCPYCDPARYVTSDRGLNIHIGQCHKAEARRLRKEAEEAVKSTKIPDVLTQKRETELSSRVELKETVTIEPEAPRVAFPKRPGAGVTICVPCGMQIVANEAVKKCPECGASVITAHKKLTLHYTREVI